MFGRKNNNCNVICLAARFTALEMVKEIFKVFMESPFKDGKHECQVNKVVC